jgi:phosphoglycolate phosphatase
MPKAVLFDYDGTLLDSVEEVYRGTCNVFRKSGFLEPTFETFFETYDSSWKIFYRKHGIEISLEKIAEWYFEVARPEECYFFNDVNDVIDILATRGVLMGIISAHYKDKIVDRCREIGLNKHMRTIIGRANDKVEFILDFCREHGVNPAETYYVGDFISDVRDAKKAGVVAVGITRGKETSEILRRHGADHCISNLHELLRLL